jgi:predicted nucleic acid-binding protein
MIIVCDTSVLSALAEIGLLKLLAGVAGPVTIPEAVAAECRQAGAPQALRSWIDRPPPWLVVTPDPPELLEETAGLDRGEAAAITLAWQACGNVTLVIDEKKGRVTAAALGLPITGTLALLVAAALRKQIDFEQALNSLVASGFRLSPGLIAAAKRRVAGAQGGK